MSSDGSEAPESVVCARFTKLKPDSNFMGSSEPSEV